MRVARIIVGIALAAGRRAQAPDGSIEATARSVAAAWEKAWNAHDMEALSDVVDERVDFIRVAAFKEHHTRLHTSSTVGAVKQKAYRPMHIFAKP